jgi:C4-type Zn-finger protein
MAKTGPTDLPEQNPCAQCGKPIAFPDWVEESPGRAVYLWHCWACDYRFEAIACFDESEPGREDLAA